MAILKRNDVLTLSANVQIMDMFYLNDVIYYLARSVSQEGVTSRDLTDIPLTLLCADTNVSKIPDEAVEYAKHYVAQKYG